MTTEESLQALIVLAGGALAGYAIYSHFKGGRERYYDDRDWPDPAFAMAGGSEEDEYDWDELLGGDDDIGERYERRRWERDEVPEFDDETNDYGEPMEISARARYAPLALDYGRRGGQSAWKASKAGYGYAREKAPVLVGHARRAGKWAGEGVRSGYEAARRYDYRGRAQSFGQGALKFGEQMDRLAYMDAPEPAPYRPVAPTLIMPEVMDYGRTTEIMPAMRSTVYGEPRMTVFGEPSQEALRNKGRRSRGCDEKGSVRQRARRYWDRMSAAEQAAMRRTGVFEWSRGSPACLTADVIAAVRQIARSSKGRNRRNRRR